MKSLKRRVYEANMELAARNLVIYTWGNVSAIDRKRHRVYIKPRGIEYKHLTEDDIVTVDRDGKLIDGSFMPSVDLDIHLAIYRNFGKITGVAHTHSTCATAWAQACREIPVLGTTHADHFYGSIPCTLPLSKE
ncbi:MAG: L-ribulose-5-phosphate 4-epimerase, partial [Proteobacteria bacterium]|nr:L-ribulose-5-phosphate 4-epimerase [Pseudomonadota bacterium]